MTAFALVSPRPWPGVSLGLEGAIGEAAALILAAGAHATMLADLGRIDLPAPARADPMQMRAVASLYLASTLEAAGLIEACDDLTRLVRTGALPGDLGDAAGLIDAFWDERNQRPGTEERLALFSRLFGAPAGPVDAASGANAQFEETLLDLCDAIMEAADRGGTGRVRAAGVRLAENVGAVANDLLLTMAREIIASLSAAIAILNHPQVRALLLARTLWDTVASIDRRFRRPPRPTLSHLRRGRAGMAVLAWLADVLDRIEQASGPLVSPGDGVVAAAVDWVDESLSVLRTEERAAGAGDDSSAVSEGGSTWLDLAR